MRRVFLTAVLLFGALSLLLPAGMAMADETRTITATWGYDNPPSDLAGFRFYRDGQVIHTVTDPAAREATFDTQVADGEQAFTMAAVDSAGGESGQSDPFPVDPPPGSAPILLQFRIGQ